MKKLSSLFSLLFLMTLAAFTSCKDDEGSLIGDPVDEGTEILSGTWKVTAVTRDDGIPADIAGVTITLTFTEAGVYSASGADGVMPGQDPAFPTTGSWEFPDDETVNQILISGSDIDFNSVTLSDDVLTFSYTTQDAKLERMVVSVTAEKQ